MPNLDFFRSILDQLTQLTQSFAQFVQNFHECPAGPPTPEELPEDELRFFVARRQVEWDGGGCLFSSRKKKRYDLLAFLWEHVGKPVSAEEIANAFFDRANWNWPSLRRYVQRLQGDDLTPKNCPYYIRIDDEELTLLPLFALPVLCHD